MSDTTSEQIEYYMEKYKAANEVAKVETYQEICKKVEYVKYQLGKQIDCKQEKFNELQVLKDELNREEQMNYLGFFTLNFSPNVSLDNITKCITKIVSKKWMKSWAYCYEQRGETLKTVQGIHIHLVFFRGNHRPARCCSEVFNSYHQFQGRTYEKVKENDFKFYPYEFLQDKLQYMSGNKWDKDKLKKVKVDTRWRKKNDLQRIYINNLTIKEDEVLETDEVIL